MYQYQQQRIINFHENFGYHHIEYYEGYYNVISKIVKISMLTKEYTTRIKYVENFCFLFNSSE